MGLVKITFDGSNVTSKQDADINFHVTGLVPAGIIRGIIYNLCYSRSYRTAVFKIFGIFAHNNLLRRCSVNTD